MRVRTVDILVSITVHDNYIQGQIQGHLLEVGQGQTLRPRITWWTDRDDNRPTLHFPDVQVQGHAQCRLVHVLVAQGQVAVQGQFYI